MIDRPKGGERAILVHLEIAGEPGDKVEFRDLALAAGAIPIEVIGGSRAVPDPRFYIGSGKAEEIRGKVAENQVDVVIFDHALSPAQERNLERLFQCRVLDRAGLILDIFAQRARSFEGKLQVELAQLRHLSTRLVRGWTHLERQRGGIGLRGPGETQLETDRRLISARIKQIEKRLDKVQKQRAQGRRARDKAEIPAVSLVGYTNAGKSSLFNQLTGADVFAADQLFATLDPTVRRIDLGDASPVVLADTVGFVRNLPHELVAAFRATLEETRQADLLLHVVDASDLERDARIAQVNAVLKEIGAEDVPQIEIFNKIDQVEGAEAHVELDEAGRPRRIWCSAMTSAGVDALRSTLQNWFGREYVELWLRLAFVDGALRARMYRLNVVQKEGSMPSGDYLLKIRAQRAIVDEMITLGAQVVDENESVLLEDA